MNVVLWALSVVGFGLVVAGMGKLVRSATRVCFPIKTADYALAIGLTLGGCAVGLISAATMTA